MTQEQIEQLKSLQDTITKMEKHQAKLIKHGERVSVLHPSDGMSNYREEVPLAMVPGLHRDVMDLIIDSWEIQLIQLRKKRDKLCICIADESTPHYKPVNNID